MKLLIAGGRDFQDYDRLKKYIDWLRTKYDITEIVSGMARGADTLGYMYAMENNIKVAKFPAEWNLYGNKAGYVRNFEMGKYCDNAVIFWDGKSKGTKSMIDIMEKMGKKIALLRY